MSQIKILYIFTSGNFKSANNKKWFDLFQKMTNLDISVAVQDCDDELKKELNLRFSNPGNVIYFKTLSAIKEMSILNRIIYLKKIARKIDQRNPEIIHIQGCFYTYMIKPLFFLKTKPKLIYNIWGSDFNLSYFKRLKNKLIIDWLFRNSALIWTNWYAMADSIKNKFPKISYKVKTIPWGVEADLFSPATTIARKKIREQFKLGENQFIMLYVRGFTPNSNHKRLLSSLQYLDNSLDYKLILHYSRKNSKMDAELKELISKYNLTKKVIISHGYLSNDEMKALFELSHLSFSLTTMEQFSRSISEAILTDTHLVVNDNAPYRYAKDVFKLNLTLVDVTNEKQLAKKLSEFITLQKAPDWSYEKLFVEKVLNFDKNYSEFEKAYHSLLKERN